MTPPLFSVIMPLFNHAAYVAEAIESVLAQTLSNWELVICNDGSSDNSLDVAMRYNDPRIHLITKHLNQGGPDALNSALLISRGQRLCWLSSDDVYHPEKLAHHQRHFEMNPSATVTVAPHGVIIGNERKASGQITPPREQKLTTFLYFNYINGLSVAMDRRELARAGMFSPKYPHCADMHRWLTLFRITDPIYFNGSPLTFTRINTSSQTDTHYGTAFEPARMLFNELCKYGLVGFVPSARPQERADPRDISDSEYQTALLAVLDTRNLMYRWGLGSAVEMMVANELRALNNPRASAISNVSVGQHNLTAIEPLKRVIALIDSNTDLTPLSLAHYAIDFSSRASDDGTRAFFHRYIRTTLQ
jgi:hypothetical protein